MSQQNAASIARNGRSIPIMVARNPARDPLPTPPGQQTQGLGTGNRRRSISLVEETDDQLTQDKIKVDPDATPVVKRKPGINPALPRPSSYLFTDEFDKMADEIINSVKSIPSSPSNKAKQKQPREVISSKPTGVVRRSSSGYSTGSASSVRVLKPTISNDKSSRMSFTGLWNRTSSTTSSTSTSTSPVQTRIANKATSTSKKKSNSSASASPKATKSSGVSDDKRSQFTQARSKTGLNIFGGRRRSIAISDDAYNAAMRAAKSHLDLRDSQLDLQPQESAASDATNRKTLAGTKSAAAEAESPVKKHFGERPWIELEKLWRGRLKNPAPDLTENFLTVPSSLSKKAQTLPVNSRPPARSSKKKQPLPEQWPPSSPPRRTASNASSTPTVSISREAAKKAVNLTSGEVLEEWRQQQQINLFKPAPGGLTRPHSMFIGNPEDHFSDLVQIW